MTIRTTSSKVQDILGRHYDDSTDLTGFITTASSLVDKVSSNDSDVLLNATSLEIVERWLAAHCYAHMDQLMSSESGGGASGQYQGQTAMYFDSTQYGQMAMVLDVTGYLAKLNKQAKEGRMVASMVWLGTEYKGDNSEDAGDQ